MFGGERAVAAAEPAVFAALGRRRKSRPASRQPIPPPASLADGRAVVPNDDEIDGSTTLRTGGDQGGVARTRTLKALTTRYLGAWRYKMYRDHKKAVIAEDNAKLGGSSAAAPS